VRVHLQGDRSAGQSARRLIQLGNGEIPTDSNSQVTTTDFLYDFEYLRYGVPRSFVKVNVALVKHIMLHFFPEQRHILQLVDNKSKTISMILLSRKRLLHLS